MYAINDTSWRNAEVSMIYLFLISNIILLVIAFMIAKDVLSPAVLFCIPWIITSIILLCSPFDITPNSVVYLYMTLGSVLFEIGYFIANRRVRLRQRLWNDEGIITIKLGAVKIVLIIEGIFLVYLLYRYASFIMNNPGVNIFMSFYANRETFSGLNIISYGRVIVNAITVFIVVLYLFIEKEEKSKYVRYMVLQIIIGSLCAITLFTRNGILLSLLPIAIALMIALKVKSRRAFVILLIGVLLFMLFFAGISSSKYWYLFQNGNFFATVWDQITLYAAGSFVALQKAVDGGLYAHQNGSNTFRTFLAIFDSIRGTNYAPALEQPVISIGNGETTNVYTFYYWYICDFGWIYAMIVQFIVGIINGGLYKGVVRKKPFSIYMFSLLIYPLIMQFFEDQYVSLLTTWIIYLIVGILLFRTNLIITTFKRFE